MLSGRQQKYLVARLFKIYNSLMDNILRNSDVHLCLLFEYQSVLLIKRFLSESVICKHNFYLKKYKYIVWRFHMLLNGKV